MKPIIRCYQRRDQSAVIELILAIQQQEFGVQITADDQPDLTQIPVFYQQGNGQFWVAVVADKLVGTLALVDIGNHQVALRKMFVDAAFRGRSRGVAEQLLQTAVQWCVNRQLTGIYLGTISVYQAAMRFYEKHGFERIAKQQLPEGFPVIAVDDVFFHKPLGRD